MVLISTQVLKLSTSYNISNTFWPLSIEGYDRLIFLFHCPRKQVLWIDYIRRNHSWALRIPSRILKEQQSLCGSYPKILATGKGFYVAITVGSRNTAYISMTWVSKPLLPTVYLRVRDGNGINFSIITRSRNQICWQHFKWPSWSRAEGSHVRHLKEEGGGEEEGYKTSGLSNMVWVDLETIWIWKILYSVQGEVMWAALP